MKKETVISCVKTGLRFIADAGIELLFGKFASDLAEKRGATKVERACMVFGGAVLGGAASEAAGKYLDETIDDTLKLCGAVKTFGNGLKDDLDDDEEDEDDE